MKARSKSQIIAWMLAVIVSLNSSGWGAWTMSWPYTGMSQQKDAVLIGAGGTNPDEAGDFVFWYLDANDDVQEEGRAAVTVLTILGTTWSGQLTPPAGGWNVSPLDAMSMPIGDHSAAVEQDGTSVCGVSGIKVTN